MTNRFGLFTALFIFLGFLSAPALAGTDGTKAVYHVNNSAKASAALRNINNHLNADPNADIVVVTHSKGVDFLLDGAEDKNGNPYNIKVEQLQARGVDFRVCNNTLKSRKIDKADILPGASIVPSGVAEIAKLQAREGYVYVKP